MKYLRAQTVEEALQALMAAAGTAKVIAGGTDLMIDLEEGKVTADILVDVSQIPGLAEIRQEGDKIIVGCGVTHTMAARSEIIRRGAPALAEACGTVGSLQIRNIATVIGNVANGQPAADAAVALAALGAECQVADADGYRNIPMTEMYAGFGKSVVDSRKEMITQLEIPCQQKGEAGAFIRLELRKSLALPMLNMAAMVHVEENIVQWSRITMAPVGVGPVRATAAEQWLQGKVFDTTNRQKAAALVIEDANPRSNPLRGSREYRLETLPVLAERTLASIAAQLGVD